MVLSLPAQASDNSTISTLDGVYSYQQALQGKRHYRAICAQCHKNDLSGDEKTAPLVGNTFWLRWGNHSVAELFYRIKGTMPLDERAGSLEDALVIDVVAYLLQANDLPSSKTAVLRVDAKQLEAINITAR